MNRFPNQNNWSVAHGKDFFADLVRTQNMSFEKPGFAQVAPNPTVIYTDGDNSGFGDPLAIVPIASVYYVVTNDEVFSFSPTTNSVTNLTTTSMPSLGVTTDAVSYQAQLHVSGGTTAKYWDGDSWENAISGLSSSAPHPMCVVEQLNHLAIGNGRTVLTYDTSYSLQTTLTLPSEYIVTGLQWRQNYVYIFTRNIYGRNAKMFVWTGTGTTAQSAYDVGCDWIYSGCEFLSSIVIVVSSGQILRFNGGGFDELGAFPVYYSSIPWTSDATTSSLRGRILPRGMVSDGQVLLMNVDGEVNVANAGYSSGYLHDQPSGVWCLDPDVGLYHLAGFPMTKYRTLTIDSLSNNAFAFSEGHEAETGDAVYASESTGLTGITERGTYFAIKVSETTLKLALTPEDALLGNAITLGGSVSGDTLSFYTNDSVGAISGSRNSGMECGPIAIFSQSEINPWIGNRFFFGGVSIDESGADSNFFASLGIGSGVGSFVTTPVESSSVTETWNKLTSFVKNLKLSSDKVIFKYRAQEDRTSPTLPAEITWTSPTTFTVDSTAYDFRRVAVDDEITLISGAGAGHYRKVSAIDTTSTTYEITISEAVPGISSIGGELSTVVTENWKEIATLTNTTTTIPSDFSSDTISGAEGKWVQFKVEVRGKVALRSLNIINTQKKQNG